MAPASLGEKSPVTQAIYRFRPAICGPSSSSAASRRLEKLPHRIAFTSHCRSNTRTACGCTYAHHLVFFEIRGNMRGGRQFEVDLVRFIAIGIQPFFFFGFADCKVIANFGTWATTYDRSRWSEYTFGANTMS